MKTQGNPTGSDPCSLDMRSDDFINEQEEEDGKIPAGWAWILFYDPYSCPVKWTAGPIAQVSRPRHRDSDESALNYPATSRQSQDSNP